MNNSEIFQKAIEKAEINGYDSRIHLHNDGEPIAGIQGTFHNIIEVIFSHEFAKALNFKLKDLGAWCDEGKNPIDFIANLL